MGVALTNKMHKLTSLVMKMFLICSGWYISDYGISTNILICESQFIRYILVKKMKQGHVGKQITKQRGKMSEIRHKMKLSV